MAKFLITLVFLCFYNISYGQNTFFLGRQKFPATERISFKMRADGHYGLDCIIAKKEQGGIIALSTESMTGVLIRGTTYLYLEDGNIITLIDRKIYDQVDNISSTVFYLTESEMNTLRSTNINKIRFSLKCGNCISSSEQGNFSAENKFIDIESFGMESTNEIPAKVEALYE